jgi:DNA-binding NarL/FixJ family response regulator
MNPLRVLVVDDHPLMCDAISDAIRAEADLIVVGQAASGVQAVVQARALSPDVIVMDLFMPGMDGVQATAAICAVLPSARILMLTSGAEEAQVGAAVQAGVQGYLLKDADRAELLHAIRLVGRGGSYLPSRVAVKLLHHLQGQNGAVTATPPLSPREAAIYALLGEGATNRAIAQQLNISPPTVRVHIHHILRKLKLTDRTQAVTRAAAEAFLAARSDNQKPV